MTWNLQFEFTQCSETPGNTNSTSKPQNKNYLMSTLACQTFRQKAENKFY